MYLDPNPGSSSVSLFPRAHKDKRLALKRHQDLHNLAETESKFLAEWFGRKSRISEFPISSLAGNGQLGYVQDNPSFDSSVALTHVQLVCSLPVKILKMGWVLFLSVAH